MAVNVIEPVADIGAFHQIKNAVGSAVAYLDTILTSLSKALQCAAEFERLDALSDDALAARGLNRQDLTRVVFEKCLKD